MMSPPTCFLFFVFVISLQLSTIVINSWCYGRGGVGTKWSLFSGFTFVWSGFGWFVYYKLLWLLVK